MYTLTIRYDSQAVTHPSPVEQFALQTLLALAERGDVVFRQVHDREFTIRFNEELPAQMIPHLIRKAASETAVRLDPTLITPNVRAYLELHAALDRARAEGEPWSEERLERLLQDLYVEVFSDKDHRILAARTITYQLNDQDPDTTVL